MSFCLALVAVCGKAVAEAAAAVGYACFVDRWWYGGVMLDALISCAGDSTGELAALATRKVLERAQELGQIRRRAGGERDWSCLALHAFCNAASLCRILYWCSIFLRACGYLRVQVLVRALHLVQVLVPVLRLICLLGRRAAAPAIRGEAAVLVGRARRQQVS